MSASGPAFERWLLAAARRTGADLAARRLTRRRVAIVMYHGFTADASHDGIANHEGKHVRAGAFRAHLAFLAARHRVLPLEEIVDALSRGASLPDHTAAITIDDGYRSIHTVAWPLLREFGLPASVFLATDFVDGGRRLWTDRVEFAVDRSPREVLDVTVGGEPMRLPLGDRDARMAADRRLRSRLKALPQEALDAAVAAVEEAAGCRAADGGPAGALYEPLAWAEIAEMAASGLVTFGSHTHAHVILARCEPARAAEELRVSKGIIEDRLGRPCRLFCYPNGRTGDFNDTTTRLVRGHGFAGALTTVYGANGRRTDVYRLRRYNLGKPLGAGELEVRLSGLFDVGSLVRPPKPAPAGGAAAYG